MDLSELKGIISLMQKSDLSDLEIETQDLKLRLGRPGSGTIVPQTIAPPVNQTSQDPQINEKPVKETIEDDESYLNGVYLHLSEANGRNFLPKTIPRRCGIRTNWRSG